MKRDEGAPRAVRQVGLILQRVVIVLKGLHRASNVNFQRYADFICPVLWRPLGSGLTYGFIPRMEEEGGLDVRQKRFQSGQAGWKACIMNG